jgi:hypothetical protein
VTVSLSQRRGDLRETTHHSAEIRPPVPGGWSSFATDVGGVKITVAANRSESRNPVEPGFRATAPGHTTPRRRCLSLHIIPRPGCATSRVIIPVRIATNPKGIPELTRTTPNSGRIRISVTHSWTRISEGCATSQNGSGWYRFLEYVRIPSTDNPERVYKPLADPTRESYPSHPLNTAPH